MKKIIYKVLWQDVDGQELFHPSRVFLHGRPWIFPPSALEIDQHVESQEEVEQFCNICDNIKKVVLHTVMGDDILEEWILTGLKFRSFGGGEMYLNGVEQLYITWQIDCEDIKWEALKDIEVINDEGRVQESLGGKG